jgi:ergothioneine biosynthesis protein EgtB
MKPVARSMSKATLSAAPKASTLAERYAHVRGFSERLCEPLVTEDYVVQSMPDVSPTKWHLAHTSWFFETFVLKPHHPGYRELDPAYAFLFNSYYTQVGPRHCRPERGYLSRPTVEEVLRYRSHVDEAMQEMLSGAAAEAGAHLIEVGLHHEQQHQELMLTDIKHVFSVNPLRPAYREPSGATEAAPAAPLEWIGFPGGVHEIGHAGAGFVFDNETPRHRTYLQPFALGSRLVTNGEYLAFIEDGGYARPELWLSLGWEAAGGAGWSAPFYWEASDGGWTTFTLEGTRSLDPAEPVTHLTYFEADAFARWAGERLPTEAEWEVAAATVPVQGNLAETGRFHPDAAPRTGGGRLQQMFGDVWEWTQSPYSPYPGYRPEPGALGEYNGKFMCNQFVLRGGSCATSLTHIRPTYRNFFPADAAWQFSGIRLARDA